jgi:hypothetical protein
LENEWKDEIHDELTYLIRWMMISEAFMTVEIKPVAFWLRSRVVPLAVTKVSEVLALSLFRSEDIIATYIVMSASYKKTG